MTARLGNRKKDALKESTTRDKTHAGAASTRAAVVTELLANGFDQTAIGSRYFSTAGKMYLRVALSTPAVAADWQRVTTTAAD